MSCIAHVISKWPEPHEGSIVVSHCQSIHDKIIYIGFENFFSLVFSIVIRSPRFPLLSLSLPRASSRFIIHISIFTSRYICYLVFNKSFLSFFLFIGADETNMCGKIYDYYFFSHSYKRIQLDLYTTTTTTNRSRFTAQFLLSRPYFR